MVFLEGRPDAPVNAVHAIAAGCVEAFHGDPWPAVVHAAGGSVLLVFEKKSDAHEVHRKLEKAWQIGQQLRLAMTPAAGAA